MLCRWGPGDAGIRYTLAALSADQVPAEAQRWRGQARVLSETPAKPRMPCLAAPSVVRIGRIGDQTLTINTTAAGGNAELLAGLAP